MSTSVLMRNREREAVQPKVCAGGQRGHPGCPIDGDEDWSRPPRQPLPRESRSHEREKPCRQQSQHRAPERRDVNLGGMDFGTLQEQITKQLEACEAESRAFEQDLADEEEVPHVPNVDATNRPPRMPLASATVSSTPPRGRNELVSQPGVRPPRETEQPEPSSKLVGQTYGRPSRPVEQRSMIESSPPRPQMQLISWEELLLGGDEDSDELAPAPELDGVEVSDAPSDKPELERVSLMSTASMLESGSPPSSLLSSTSTLLNGGNEVSSQHSLTRVQPTPQETVPGHVEMESAVSKVAGKKVDNRERPTSLLSAFDLAWAELAAMNKACCTEPVAHGPKPPPLPGTSPRERRAVGEAAHPSDSLVSLAESSLRSPLHANVAQVPLVAAEGTDEGAHMSSGCTAQEQTNAAAESVSKIPTQTSCASRTAHAHPPCTPTAIGSGADRHVAVANGQCAVSTLPATSADLPRSLTLSPRLVPSEISVSPSATNEIVAAEFGSICAAPTDTSVPLRTDCSEPPLSEARASDSPGRVCDVAATLPLGFIPQVVAAPAQITVPVAVCRLLSSETSSTQAGTAGATVVPSAGAATALDLSPVKSPRHGATVSGKSPSAAPRSTHRDVSGALQPKSEAPLGAGALEVVGVCENVWDTVPSSIPVESSMYPASAAYAGSNATLPLPAQTSGTVCGPPSSNEPSAAPVISTEDVASSGIRVARDVPRSDVTEPDLPEVRSPSQVATVSPSAVGGSPREATYVVELGPGAAQLSTSPPEATPSFAVPGSTACRDVAADAVQREAEAPLSAIPSDPLDAVLSGASSTTSIAHTVGTESPVSFVPQLLATLLSAEVESPSTASAPMVATDISRASGLSAGSAFSSGATRAPVSSTASSPSDPRVPQGTAKQPSEAALSALRKRQAARAAARGQVTVLPPPRTVLELPPSLEASTTHGHDTGEPSLRADTAPDCVRQTSTDAEGCQQPCSPGSFACSVTAESREGKVALPPPLPSTPQKSSVRRLGTPPLSPADIQSMLQRLDRGTVETMRLLSNTSRCVSPAQEPKPKQEVLLRVPPTGDHQTHESEGPGAEQDVPTSSQDTCHAAVHGEPTARAEQLLPTVSCSVSGPEEHRELVREARSVSANITETAQTASLEGAVNAEKATPRTSVKRAEHHTVQSPPAATSNAMSAQGADALSVEPSQSFVESGVGDDADPVDLLCTPTEMMPVLANVVCAAGESSGDSEAEEVRARTLEQLSRPFPDETECVKTGNTQLSPEQETPSATHLEKSARSPQTDDFLECFDSEGAVHEDAIPARSIEELSAISHAEGAVFDRVCGPTETSLVSNGQAVESRSNGFAVPELEHDTLVEQPGGGIELPFTGALLPATSNTTGRCVLDGLEICQETGRGEHLQETSEFQALRDVDESEIASLAARPAENPLSATAPTLGTLADPMSSSRPSRQAAIVRTAQSLVALRSRIRLEAEASAAVRLQAVWRGYLLRQRLSVAIRMGHLCLVVQHHRGSARRMPTNDVRVARTRDACTMTTPELPSRDVRSSECSPSPRSSSGPPPPVGAPSHLQRTVPPPPGGPLPPPSVVALTSVGRTQSHSAQKLAHSASLARNRSGGRIGVHRVSPSRQLTVAEKMVSVAGRLASASAVTTPVLANPVCERLPSLTTPHSGSTSMSHGSRDDAKRALSMPPVGSVRCCHSDDAHGRVQRTGQRRGQETGLRAKHGAAEAMKRDPRLRTRTVSATPRSVAAVGAAGAYGCPVAGQRRCRTRRSS
uniref:Uncharacterized protein n=1 Tax=Noctiluca scintillans TaxID=2966 RepID=A0A7S1FCS0_NOCSC|mmetsp:Transcript_50624/g.134811  ORF Transcript_50624/g.134811 Transcript_50624/m.134811 type:complete len:1769 (+) Transcript_50624:97-5403(+)